MSFLPEIDKTCTFLDLCQNERLKVVVSHCQRFLDVSKLVFKGVYVGAEFGKGLFNPFDPFKRVDGTGGLTVAIDKTREFIFNFIVDFANFVLEALYFEFEVENVFIDFLGFTADHPR